MKSSLEGLKTTKWTPAAGLADIPSRSGSALHAKGLSSVLKSARCGIAVPGPYTAPLAPTAVVARRDTVCNDAECPICFEATKSRFTFASLETSSGPCGTVSTSSDTFSPGRKTVETRSSWGKLTYQASRSSLMCDTARCVPSTK